MEDAGMGAWGVGGGIGVLIVLGRLAWEKIFSPEARANDALVAQLTERIGAQENRLTALETGMDEERKARRDAETKVYELKMQIMRLEFELRKHGIQVPE